VNGRNLLDGPEPTVLPDEPQVRDALRPGEDPAQVVRAHPESSLAWAALADQAWQRGAELEAYAYARVGYHRGLDALRRNGWRGHGPVPASEPGNEGFRSCLALLGQAAAAIGEQSEADRCAQFLVDLD
jgi:hypothetical protein